MKNDGNSIQDASASGLPSGLSIDTSTGVISGTPTSKLAKTAYTVSLANKNKVIKECTIYVTVNSPSDSVADHLVVISGDGQIGSPGAALSQSLRVQVQDQYNNAWAGGVTLGLMRMLGVDTTSYSATVTTDSNGYASFPVSLGYSPTAWQILPMGSTLPNASGARVAFAASPTNLGNGTFQGAVGYPAGTTPFGAAVGDFNRDGKLDVAVGNANTVSILTGVGDGTFLPQVSLNGPIIGYSVATGDFNGDGKLDLVTGNFNSSPLATVYMGNGDGTFGPKVDYSVGGSVSQAVVIGDFNRDGKLDVALATNAGTICILLGVGDGTFQLPVTFPSAANPQGIVTADLNGDGKLDLAVPDYSNGVMSVHLGNGDGTFQAKTDYAAGTNPRAIEVGDFNGDRKLDLVVSNYMAFSLSLFLGNGDGTFSTSSVLTAGQGPTNLVAVDFNGDGKLDIAENNWGNGSMGVLMGNGDGTFQSTVFYSTGTRPFAIAPGDFNGDGKIDLVSACRNSGLAVLLGS